MKPPRSNPNGVVQQSPGLARRQPWVIARQCPSTPTGLRPGGRKTSRLRSLLATTPLGLIALHRRYPGLSLRSNPGLRYTTALRLKPRTIYVHDHLA